MFEDSELSAVNNSNAACNSYNSGCGGKERNAYSCGTFQFKSPINGLDNAKDSVTGESFITFFMRRKNRVVTLQWNPFSGTVAATGLDYIDVSMSVENMPSGGVYNPIYLKYAGEGRNTHIRLIFCPTNVNTGSNISFALNTNGSGSDVYIGDLVSFPGGSTSWIVD